MWSSARPETPETAWATSPNCAARALKECCPPPAWGKRKILRRASASRAWQWRAGPALVLLVAMASVVVVVVVLLRAVTVAVAAHTTSGTDDARKPVHGVAGRCDAAEYPTRSKFADAEI